MPPRLVMPARNRVALKLPPSAVTSYVLLSPKDTRAARGFPQSSVVAACKDAGCEKWARGWDTILDERTPKGRTIAEYLRSGRSGREFRELPGGGPGRVTVFRFPPHQRCFREHRTRPEVGLVRGGDWRGNPRGERRVHKNLADWQEDSAIHQQRLAEAVRRG